MNKVPLLSAFIALTCLTGAAQTQAKASPAPITPLLANLTYPLDASLAKVGRPVHAAVTSPWSSEGCQLAVGAYLYGHVSKVDRRSKTDHKSSLHLVFDHADCNRQKEVPIKLTMIALLGPFSQGRNVTDTPVGTPIGGVRSVEVPTAVNRLAPPPGRDVPTRWKAGMVIGLPNMNLTVGTGAEGGSIVWAIDTDARLEGQTTLMLIATR